MSASAAYIGKVPEVFLIADKLLEGERMAERSKIITRKARIIHMPTIKGAAGVEGPLHITQEYKDEFYKKKAVEKKKEKREYEREILECLGKKERLQYKMSKLDPKKKKENKRIISMRFRIQDLDERIEMLQRESGINLDKQDKDSKLGKIWNRVKPIVIKLYKKAKKFFKQHRDAIEGVLMVAVPVIGTAIFKKLLGL